MKKPSKVIKLLNNFKEGNISDKVYSKKINKLDVSEQLELLSKADNYTVSMFMPVKGNIKEITDTKKYHIELIINSIKKPHDFIVQYVIENYPESFLFLHSFDFSALLSQIPYYNYDDDSYVREIKLIKKYMKSNVMTNGEIQAILDINPSFASLFNELDENLQKRILLRNPYNYKYVKKPTDLISKEYLKKVPDGLEEVLNPTEEMYRFSFDLNVNMNFPATLKSMRQIPLSIIKHYFKDLNLILQKKYILYILRIDNNFSASSDFLFHLHSICTCPKQRAKIEEHPNYLGTAEIILKNLKEQE